MKKGGETLSEHSDYPHHQTVSGIWSVLAWVICLLAALFYCYEYLLRISPNVMLPELMRAFNVPSADGVAALVGYYYYAYTPMQIPVGLLLDQYGPRRVLTFATLCCAIGAVLFATTTNYAVAAMARFFIGFGSAFAFVGVLKVASIWLPPNRFAFISGFTTALGMLGGMFGNWTMNKMVATMGWDGTLSYFGWFGFFVVVAHGGFFVRGLGLIHSMDVVGRGALLLTDLHEQFPHVIQVVAQLRVGGGFRSTTL